jgi:valyl-tRNA synthetase
MTEAASSLSGMDVDQARASVVRALDREGSLLATEAVLQSVRVHERCDTPAETIVSWQWFVRILDHREEFLALGEKIRWLPAHMHARYHQWVENLAWDWCISRQRYFGVTFPVWYCDQCGEIVLADEEALPVDPTTTTPATPCACGNSRFTPEEDVMDTWATSSLTPQIVGQWLNNPSLYSRVFPMSLRPQAHDIIRTWAFYTIVKSHYHFDSLPWQAVAISGWGLAPEGTAKISKSRGGGPVSPMEMMERYSADAVRYWAAGTGFGKDAIISEEKIQAGSRLVTKLWNVARFSQRFLEPEGAGESSAPGHIPDASFSPADRWILARLQQVIQRATRSFQEFDYAVARSEIELFFWSDLADNYLEMAKKRLYDGLASGEEEATAAAARYTLYQALLATVKLFAPFIPYVSEQIYRGLFARPSRSIHNAAWPVADLAWLDERAIGHGELLVGIATAVRRYKSENGLSLGADLERLVLATSDADMALMLQGAQLDLASITRARSVEIRPALPASALQLAALHGVAVAL